MQIVKKRKIRKTRNVAIGFCSGVIGGLAASWIMNEYQYAWIKLSKLKRKENPEKDSEQSAVDENVTVKAASIISENILDRPLQEEKKEKAGNAVHYVFGALVGGMYGAVAEVMPHVRKGAGIPFGIFVWLVADELALPLLRLSKGPTKYPLALHIYALTSHFVYGSGTEILRRFFRFAIR